MIMYTSRRLAQALLVFFGITLLIYAFVYLVPGDPLKALVHGRPLSPDVAATLRRRYHLNDPFWVQYSDYLAGLFRGNLGTDFYGDPVAPQLAGRWPVTLRLAGTAWLIEVIFGIGFGIWAGIRHRKLSDRTILLLSVAAISVPVFVVGLVGQLVLGVEIGIVPVAGTSDGWPMSYLLPGAVLATFGVAAVTRLVRSSVIDNLRADYVRTALANGLSDRRVLLTHVLRNCLIPAVTYLAIDLGSLLGGTVIIEGIFNLPGIGQLLFTSIQLKEGPTTVGIGTLLVGIFLLLNLIVDLLYGVIDPRVRHV